MLCAFDDTFIALRCAGPISHVVVASSDGQGPRRLVEECAQRLTYVDVDLEDVPFSLVNQ